MESRLIANVHKEGVLDDAQMPQPSRMLQKKGEKKENKETFLKFGREAVYEPGKQCDLCEAYKE